MFYKTEIPQTLSLIFCCLFRGLHKKIPADGASLQSENSGSDMEQRREGEGSSDKNSPPTSVVLLGQADANLQVKKFLQIKVGGKNFY